ncbi:MAG TPA: dUTP diphosphatase [Ignavibacteria bacterium]|nr:dUTP diphosphatase [Ignavibacteria bacterium]HMR39236.1 dUTP diphosphatase [Ignavibacteria bacterium]
MKIKFKLHDPGNTVIIPEYKTEGSAGMDLCSSSRIPVIIGPSEVKLIPTNLILELPEGAEGQVRPRSGLALNYNVTVLNSPGTIDSDYRGEIKVLLINHGINDFEVKYGDRIAQLVIARYEKALLTEAVDVSETQRGDGGYGSTGV